MLGTRFEAEIREQPDVWRRIARSDAAQRFADAVRGRRLLFVGSGSSLFVGMLGALAHRRRGTHARALAATEAHFDHGADRDACVIALSQSGRSTDLLSAIDVLAPSTLIALTNDAVSPLAARATLVVDCLAGPETAVPASKSVTAPPMWRPGFAATKSPTSSPRRHASPIGGRSRWWEPVTASRSPTRSH